MSFCLYYIYLWCIVASGYAEEMYLHFHHFGQYFKVKVWENCTAVFVAGQISKLFFENYLSSW